MKNVSDKICRENQNKHFVFYKVYFPKFCRIWDKNTVETERPQMTIWHMRIAHSVPKPA